MMAYSFRDHRHGSRHERGYGTGWERLRAVILRRDAGICQPCLRDGHVHQGTEVDHVVPKAQGGTDDEDNLQTICGPRHRAKTAAEALAARGVAAPRVSQACDALGLPLDRRHPWAQDALAQQGRGAKFPGVEPARTDLASSFAAARIWGGGGS